MKEKEGPEGMLEEHFEAYYKELEQIAHSRLRVERMDHTLDTSALVHEAFFNLSRQDSFKFQNSEHFLAIASTAMRRILINYAKQRTRQKRGGDAIKLTYSALHSPMVTTAEEILTLHEAINILSKLNERQAKVVEYYFFGGFNHKEISGQLGVSIETVRRDWRLAKAWLSSQLKKQLL